MATGTFLLPGPGFGKNTIVTDLMDTKFKNIITVAKTGRGNFVCSDSPYNGSDTTCIQAALDHISNLGGGEIWIMNGSYNIISQLTYSGNNLIFRGQGGNAILNFSSFPTNPFPFINISGSIDTATKTSTLSADANTNTLTITVADGSKFSANDWIRVRSDAIYRPYNDTPPYGQTAGEIQQIASVSGNIITLKEYLIGSYKTTDKATVDKVSMCENLIIEDISIMGVPDVPHTGIYISQAANVTIENVHIEDAFNIGICLHDVVGANVQNNTIKRSTREGYGYGFSVENASRDITGISNHFYDCRHGIDCGGDYNYGIQYNQVYIGNTMSYDWHVVGMFGPHPTYEGLVCIGNVCTGCALGFFGGSRNTIIGNIIKNCQTTAGILLPEFSENTIVANNSIHVINNNGVEIRSNLSNISVNNNHIKCDTAGAGVLVTENGSNIKIKNNDINTPGKGINVTTYSSTSAINDIILSGNNINTTTDPGIYIESANYTISNITVSENVIKSPICIEIRCKDNKISNVMLNNNNITASSKGLYLFSTGTAKLENFDILTNVVTGGTYAIDFNYCTGINIVGNSIYNSSTNGIISHMSNLLYIIQHNRLINCVDAISNTSPVTTGCLIDDNTGHNPTNPSTPSLSSGTGCINNCGYPCMVSVYGGTVSAISINGVVTGQTSGTFVVPSGATITLTYSSAPTWKWWGL